MGLLRTFLDRFFIHGRRTMLQSGQRAPDFEVQDQHGKSVRLSDLQGRRVVLWFYPKADTPG